MYFSAFFLGLVSSLHCVGMCGAIALALPAQGNRTQFVAGRIRYNAGRMFTYSLLGGVFGVLGYGVHLAGYQQLLSVAMGLLMLGLAFFSIKSVHGIGYLPGVNVALARLRAQLGTWLTGGKRAPMFAIGVLNGLLPCGMVYTALAGATTTGSVAGGALYMLLFGLGTFPLMLAVSLIGGSLLAFFRRNLQPAMTAVTIAFGLLLLLRGMNLNIPYLSPQISTTVAECH